MKEYGLILNQELNPIKRTQSSSAWRITSRRRWAIEFWRLKDYLRNKFEHSQQWSDDMWKSKMAGDGGNKKRFQYCTDSSGQEILYLRALQGHSGRNLIDPTLQDNVSIPNNFFEYIYHIGCGINLHSITNSGLILGGQNSSRERQTVFSTAVNPINKNHKDPHELDLTKPRLASCKQKKWKRHQDTVYWVDIQLAQRKGSKFYQTRCNAIILYDTLPAYCISKVVVMEIIYEKVYVSPRPRPTISFKDNWMKELDSEVPGSSKDTQRIQPKPKTQLSRTVRPVGGQDSTKEIEKYILFGHEDIKHSTRTVRPVGGFKSIQSCMSMPLKIEEEDQTRTGRPEGGQESTEVEGLNIDFRVPGLSHAVVKEAEHFRVQEVVKKIESHRHREALQADLQQNNVYNPFSNNSKAMIRELGNVELFELCETITKVQCSHCLLYWNQRNCVLHLRTLPDWQRIQKKVQQTTIGCTLYPELRDNERTHSWCSTWQDRSTKRGPSGLECVEEMLQKNWLSRWTFYRNSRSISQRSSLSWITTRNRMDRTRVQRDGWTGKNKITRTISLQSNSKYTKDNGIAPWISQAKMGLCDDPNFGLQSLSKTVFTVSLVSKLQNQFLRSNVGDGTLSQAIHGGPRLAGVGGAHNKNLKDLFFITVGFVYSRWRSTVTDGECRQIHLTRHFSHALHTS